MKQIFYTSLIILLLVDLHHTIFVGTSQEVFGVRYLQENINCQGDWSEWTPCQPFEGHLTHHDSDDIWNIPEDENRRPLANCFKLRTYKISQPRVGKGKNCLFYNGTNQFETCDSCSSIPAVEKRINAPPPPLGTGPIFGAVIAVTLGMSLLLWISYLLYRYFSKRNRNKIDIQSQNGTAINGIEFDGKHFEENFQPSVLGKLASDYYDDERATEAGDIQQNSLPYFEKL